MAATTSPPCRCCRPSSTMSACQCLPRAGSPPHGGWRQAWPPEYGGRALRNRFFERWEGREPELASDDHAYAELLAALERHDFDTACIYAGQSVGLIQRSRPAAEVVADLATAAELLRRTASVT